MNKQQRTQILELRKIGKNYEQIEEALGIKRESIKSVCLRNGLGLSKEEIEESRARANAKRSESNRKATIEWWKNRGAATGEDLMNRLPVGLFYVGGFCNDNSDVEIACEKCGNSFFRKGQTVRKRMIKSCPICELFEREEREYLAEMDRLYQANEKELDREAKAVEKEQKRLNIVETRTCPVCGKEFNAARQSRGSRRVYCSTECSKKHDNSIASHRKDHRITGEKRIDKGITARSLFKRDKGICWICGCQCNLEDYTIREGAFIAGDWYPSVDHIIPICEGGEDSWENVKLAHRSCNTKRYWDEFHAPWSREK